MPILMEKDGVLMRQTIEIDDKGREYLVEEIVDINSVEYAEGGMN